MFNLNFDETRVMFETNRYRVVAIGRSGWSTDLCIELAHKDAMGEMSWHIVDAHELSSSGTYNSGGGGVTIAVEVLGAALARIKWQENELAQASERMVDMQRELDS